MSGLHLVGTEGSNEAERPVGVDLENGYEEVTKEMQAIRQRIQSNFPGMVFQLGRISLDGGSGDAIMSVRVQGEYKDAVRQLLPNAIVETLTQKEYDDLRGPDRSLPRAA